MLESLIYRLQEGDYVAHVERTVVENDGEDELLADRYRAVGVCNRRVARSADAYRGDLRRYYLKQCADAVPVLVERTEVRYGYRALLNVVFCEPVVLGYVIIFFLAFAGEGFYFVLSGL